jgi:mono/diheme cytochrome c family protein
MHPIPLGLSLIIVATLSACGDSSTSGDKAQTGPAAVSAPGPWDTLAALAPEDQPYGLDVYTEKCLSCHGNLGQGVGKNPSIKGLTSTAMQLKLLDYRAAKFKGKTDLSDAEIAAVAIYAGE